MTEAVAEALTEALTGACDLAPSRQGLPDAAAAFEKPVLFDAPQPRRNQT